MSHSHLCPQVPSVLSMKGRNPGVCHVGGVTPAAHCQNLLTLARASIEASNVDGTDFLSGCREGVEDALKIVSPPPPTPQTVYVPVPAQTTPYLGAASATR